MTDPADPRPTPVLDAAKLGGLVGTVFVTCGGVYFLITQGITADQLSTLGAGITAAVTALVALAVYATSVIHGRAAQTQVTPLDDPRDAQMRPLKTVEEWAATWGRHSTTSPLEDPPMPLFGIHAHPTKKLGKRPPKKAAAVNFAAFVRSLPDRPLADPPPGLAWPMDRNDEAGDCVVAGLDHALQAICAALGVPRQNWTDDQLLALYQTQNPDFRSWSDAGGSADRGMDIQTFLEHLVATGQILAFGRVDPTAEDQMKAAVYLGLAVVTGEMLETAQQTQTVWDYHRSGTWGGHCTATVGYLGSPDQQAIVTWGELVDVTQAFIAHQMDEAWFVLTQAHVDHPGFRNHYDLAGFAAAVADLTAGKVIVPVPPQPLPPSPAPTPPPAPSPSPAGFPLDAWDAFAAHPYSRTKQHTAIAAVNAWLGQ